MRKTYLNGDLVFFFGNELENRLNLAKADKRVRALTQVFSLTWMT